MAKNRECIDLSAFWQAADEQRFADAEQERQRIAAALSRVAAGSSGIAWQGLVVHGVQEVAVTHSLDFQFKGAGGEVIAETSMPWIWCKALVVKRLWDSTAELLAVSEDWAG